MRIRFSSLLAAAIAGASLAAEPNPPAAAGDWPWWRGPRLDNTAHDRGAVLKWGPAENVVWRTAVPGRGHSSPAVSGDRVFLTTADEAVKTLQVLAFDRRTGKPLWTHTAHEGGFTKVNPKNSHASATPACDGERVYAAFVNGTGLFVTAADLDGKRVWQTRAGGFRSQHGYGSSPVLYRDLVIVNGDNLDTCFVAALDRRMGKVAWRTDRPTSGKNGSYGTPVVATLAGRDQLILTGMGETAGYDPATGTELWKCSGPAEVTGNTPAVGGGLVFTSGGFPEKVIQAVRADGRGDVTATHVAWKATKGAAYVPSPLYHAGRLYVVADNGVVTCFEAATGKEVWIGRLRGGFSASPVLVGEHIIVSNEKGETFVLRAGPKFELVGTNDLGDGAMATPAVAGGRLFVRTAHNLFCIGKP